MEPSLPVAVALKRFEAPVWRVVFCGATAKLTIVDFECPGPLPRLDSETVPVDTSVEASN
jgi:hypothetical protein